MPRLIALMRDYGTPVEVRATPEHLRHLADRWVLADGRSGTIRFHADHARGKCIADDAGGNPALVATRRRPVGGERSLFARRDTGL